MITIVDYGLGNLGSIVNMLRRIGASAEVTNEPSKIERAKKLLLPGVGAFDTGVNNLRKLGLIEALNQRVIQDKVPILGICLGAQIMTRRSEEGELPGLGWIPADTIRFFSRVPADGLKVPHMGWSKLDVAHASSLFPDQNEMQRFYFVHSFHFECDCRDHVLAWTDYGYPFAAAFNHGNVFGVQFHPEKSHKFGMNLLRRFSSI